MSRCTIKTTTSIKLQPISAIDDKCSFGYHDYIQIPRHVFYTNELLNKKSTNSILRIIYILNILDLLLYMAYIKIVSWLHFNIIKLFWFHNRYFNMYTNIGQKKQLKSSSLNNCKQKIITKLWCCYWSMYIDLYIHVLNDTFSHQRIWPIEGHKSWK